MAFYFMCTRGQNREAFCELDKNEMGGFCFQFLKRINGLHYVQNEVLSINEWMRSSVVFLGVVYKLRPSKMLFWTF